MGALGADQEELQEIQAAARTFRNSDSILHDCKSLASFPAAYAEMIKRRADALIFLTSAFTSFHRRAAYRACNQDIGCRRCAGSAAWTDVGCIMSYGPNLLELYRRAAVFVDKILKGTKPADIPVEQPTKFDFIVNLKTAKQIGVTIPPNLMARADRVIK